MPIDSEWGGGRERNFDVRETPIGCFSYVLRALIGDRTRNLGMCPDWELNP